MKKILAMVLVVALTAAVSIAGTMAYLTSTDSDVNVMTVGNVQVKLEEKQRNEDGSALEDFEQGKQLTPLVGSAQAEKDKWGQPKLSNYVDKIVYATNTGKNPAYIRFLIAVPVALIPDTDEASNNPLHWSYGNRVDITGTGKYNEVKYADSDWAKLFTYADLLGDDDKIASVTIDGEEYWVTYFTMKEALAPNTSSLAVMAGVYLDNRVDYDADLGKYTFNGAAIDYDFSDGVKIPVLLQGVQTEGWTSIDQAFEEAFGKMTVANAEDWFGGVEAPAVVDNAEDMNDALENGGDAILTGNITTTASSSGYGVADTVVNGGTLNGNGNTLSVEGTGDYTAVNTTGGTIENLNIDNGFRAVFLENMTEDVYLKKMNIGGEGVCYAINTGVNDGKYSLIVTDSKINGWSSYSQIKSASFTNCEFGQGGYYATAVDGRVLKPYVTTTITDCTFVDNFYLDLSSLEAGCTITLDGCTVNGVALTADIVTASNDWTEYEDATFFVELPSGRTLADCVIFK